MKTFTWKRPAKYLVVKNILKESLLNGEYTSGEKFPSQNELAKKFGVVPNTIREAVSVLVNDGLLTRHHGKGTFVTSPTPRLTTKEIVGLIMPTTGHLYESFSKRIIHGLTDHNYFCIVNNHHWGNRNSIKKIKDLIDRSPAILIIQGISKFPFNFLDNYPGKVIFLNNFESEKKLSRARYVLSDYFAGGRTVAEYFISLGHEKIIFYTHPISPGQRGHLNLIKGAKTAFKEKNLSEENFIIITDENKIPNVLETEEKPMAVFCDGDFRAKLTYETAKRLNLRIPEDVSVIGYFNTPWCEIFQPNLTSVSIREEEMADYVIEEIIGKNTNKEIILQPKLIIRDSVIKNVR
ncbi:MAG: substrate-binding domain-containing protein [Candidatus Omnitrophica bacterium]|jgi:GntR family transcriptional regulator of arabinose operon|nr:substrate-binding domain-containing protein [Candidatus Omnitrophota bacterium]